MIESQISVLQQARSYLISVSPLLYTEIVRPFFISSAGSHMRHILDHYQAIINGITTGCIDYDKRSRGGKVESDIDAALTLISDIEMFLQSLTDQQLQQKIQLSTEISVEKQQIEVIETNVARELIFASSHAIHHFAMIEQITKAQKGDTPANFGLAPATATFMRGNGSITDDKMEKDKKCAH